MKQIIFILFSVFIMTSCQREKKPLEETNKKNNTLQKTDNDTLQIVVLPWEAVYNDSTLLMEMKKNLPDNSISLTAQDMVDALNLKYPQIKLELVEITANKAVVKINESNYLTQQMGSEGARIYLAEATFALTELAEIAAVDFRFTEGDHASPQVLNRSSFKDFN